MEFSEEKPLSYAEIIQLTFSILKANFLKLFLFVLVFTGPFYVFITLLYGKFSIYGITFGAIDMSEGFFKMKYVGMNLSNLTSLEANLLIIGIIVLEIVAIPLAIASIIILVGGLKEGKKVSFGQAVKGAFFRYWALFRGGVTYFFFVVLILFFLAFVPLSLALIEGFSQRIIPIALLAVLITPTIIYIMTRMSFYFAIIIFERGIMGIRKSWELVKGKKGLRLLGLYFGIFAVDILIIWLFQLIFGTALGESSISILLEKIIFMIVLAINVVYYTIIYFDFLKRNEQIISE